jgi:hypothetical protein
MMARKVPSVGNQRTERNTTTTKRERERERREKKKERKKEREKRRRDHMNANRLANFLARILTVCFDPARSQVEHHVHLGEQVRILIAKVKVTGKSAIGKRSRGRGRSRSVLGLLALVGVHISVSTHGVAACRRRMMIFVRTLFT